MIVERFKAEHARAIELQPSQDEGAAALPEYLESLEKGGPAATLIDSDGRVICCAGIIEHPPISHLWCFVSRHAGPHMLAIYRGAQRLISVAENTVIATSVCGFEPGCRLLTMLGFTRKSRIPAYGLLGEDHDFYVRE